MSSLLLDFAQRLMTCPAAPYFEHGVRAAVEAICEEHGLAYSRDSYGNVLVEYRQGKTGRPLALAAHMDHPGFEIVEKLKGNRWRARFRGGVGGSYFQTGVAVRFMPQQVKGKLVKRLKAEKEFVLEAKGPLAGKPTFAVWELEDFTVRKEQIHGRACDDLVGCASILATMVELKQKKIAAHVIGVIARSEEVGFHGALMVAEKKRLPVNALVISLETSREMPPVKMGQGVIVRVGDRSSIFDSDATRFLSEIGAELGKEDKTFLYQRALMSGGTCEGTAYQEYGYQTAAVCVALGNYHNCGAKDKIRAEYVSTADAVGMVRLLVSAATQMKRFDKLVGKLPKRLKLLAKEARAEFRRLG